MKYKIGFIGCGNMASAIIGGLISKGTAPADIIAADLSEVATGKASEKFEINGYKKYCLMNALDDIDFLLENTAKIEAWEKKQANA